MSHEPFVDAKIRQNSIGDFILEFTDGPYNGTETYIQAHNRREVFKYVRPCEEDREAGFETEDIVSTIDTKCQVDEHYAWTRMQHEEAMEVLNG